MSIHLIHTFCTYIKSCYDKSMKKVNSNKIIKELKKEKSDRGRVTLYLSRSLFDDFSKKCKKEDVAASAVMEKLMQQFINSLK